MGQEQQQNTRTERQGGGERAERARQYLRERVHPAVAEAREDTRGDVQDAHERAGPGDPGGDGLGARTVEDAARAVRCAARTAECAPRPVRSFRNLARLFPIYPDRHRIPWFCERP
ncbi:hypothetical protein GCM10010372_35160 [Streptomyces tauricus]|nr:hypothetical protein GCM10010372_35160 [Streptomyces tauricus]